MTVNGQSAASQQILLIFKLSMSQIVLFTNTARSEHRLQRDIQSREQILQSSDKGQRRKKMEMKEKSSVTSKISEQSEEVSALERIDRCSRVKIRLTGLVLLCAIVAMLFAYGFSSNINTGSFSNQTNPLVGATLFVGCIFVVIGFSLFLGYYIENLFTSIFTVLYVVSVTIILSPLLQKLWLNIFLNGFNGGLSTSVASYAVLFGSNNTSNVGVNYSNLKLSICCAISQLLLYVAVNGRMQVYKTILVSFFFILCWNINYALCIYVLKMSPDSRFFDDYSISMVYVFGGCVTLLVALDVPSNLHIKKTNQVQKVYPKIASALGIFFIWMSFCCTSSIIGSKETSTTVTDAVRTVFYPQGSIQIFFALSASTVSTFAFSYLFNSQPKLADVFTGSISGAILYGSVAGFATNIAVPIAVGIFAAFVSTFYRSMLMKGLNRQRVRDLLGLFGPFLVVALLSVLALAPIIIRIFLDNSIVTSPMNKASISALSEAGWVIIYAGISAGIGLTAGMIISTVIRCLHAGQIRFGDRLLFLQNLNVQEKDIDDQDLETSEK